MFQLSWNWISATTKYKDNTIEIVWMHKINSYYYLRVCKHRWFKINEVTHPVAIYLMRICSMFAPSVTVVYVAKVTFNRFKSCR